MNIPGDDIKIPKEHQFSNFPNYNGRVEKR